MRVVCLIGGDMGPTLGSASVSWLLRGRSSSPLDTMVMAIVCGLLGYTGRHFFRWPTRSLVDLVADIRRRTTPPCLRAAADPAATALPPPLLPIW